ncbi:MAG: hypothetical protein HY791_33935 [Deltaproteobacteria bacterium]|nr:hypothetical protein [Deltaproteobacteria bacterium]
MSRIETIRPGGMLSSDLGAYPLPALLLGVLRGNLSGLLELGLPGVNYVAFRDGVPIALALPGLRVSLARILEAESVLDEGAREEIESFAEEAQTSESRLVRQADVVPEGVLEGALRERARRKLIALFGAGPVAFQFREGAVPPRDADIAILEPLPAIFRGMATEAFEPILKHLLGPSLELPVRLTELYPRGVDPFQWGESTESLVATGSTVSATELERQGLSRKEARAVLGALLLTGMGESIDENGVTKELSAVTGVPSALSPSTSDPDTSEPGLRPFSLDAQAATEDFEAARHHAVSSRPQLSEGDEIKRALSAFMGKDYFDVLRVRPNTGPEQLERAYRFLTRENLPDTPSRRAVLGVYEEAYLTLSDTERSAKYRRVAEQAKDRPKLLSARTSFEATRKVERALLVAQSGALHEAAALIEWAFTLDPARKDLPLLKAVFEVMAEPSSSARLSELERVADAEKAISGLVLIARALIEGLTLKRPAADVVASLPDHPLGSVVKQVLSTRDDEL